MTWRPEECLHRGLKVRRLGGRQVRPVKDVQIRHPAIQWHGPARIKKHRFFPKVAPGYVARVKPHQVPLEVKNENSGSLVNEPIHQLREPGGFPGPALAANEQVLLTEIRQCPQILSPAAASTPSDR